MTDFNIYKRQRNLNLIIPETVIVVGCGGVGSWSAIFFTMVGSKQIILVDYDVLEEHNLNRLPFSERDIGRLKVDALAELLIRLRPETAIVPISASFQTVMDSLPVLIRYDHVLVVDAVDRVDISNMILEFAKKHRYQYLDIKYDGFNFSVRYAKDPNSLAVSWDADGEAGYREIPSFVGSAVLPSLLGFLIVTLDFEEYYVRDSIIYMLEKVMRIAGSQR